MGIFDGRDRRTLVAIRICGIVHPAFGSRLHEANTARPAALIVRPEVISAASERRCAEDATQWEEGSMKDKASAETSARATTVRVSDEVFRQVYDSAASLPGKHKWVTRDEDVRGIEKILGMRARTIGAPLWLSGDTRDCRNCGRETSWLDIVASALKKAHGKELIAEVILGEKKFVNIEVPHAIADLYCYGCGVLIPDLRSFKCHNWAYAKEALVRAIEDMQRGTS